jgi:hypothetical protein
LAKHKKHEFFSTYYDRIFNDLNAAQMIIAVLAFRYCDNYRRKLSDDLEIQAQRPFSQYFISLIMVSQLLLKLNISLNMVTHRNFYSIKEIYDQNKELIYHKSEEFLVDCLHDHLHSNLHGIDGRTIAAIFRRFDLVEKYMKDIPLLKW